MKYTKKNKVTGLFAQRGFTLIEMMITIAIVGILASVVMVNMSTAKAREEVKSVASELAGRIVDARQRALKGDVSATEPACAFGVAFYNLGPGEGVNNEYSTFSWKKCGTVEADILTILYTLSNSRIQITDTSDGDHVILFNVPFGTMMTPEKFDITVSGSGYNQYVCVSSAGNVTVQEGVCP